MKFIKYFIEAFFVYLFFLIGKIIGLSLSRLLFSSIFKIIGPIIRSDKIVNKNLTTFSKSTSEYDKNKIKSNMWSNYGKTFIEYIFLKRFRDKDFHINIKGKNILEEIKKGERPVIFVSGHLANFELMSMEITKRKIDLATIYRPLNNIFLNPFMEHLRKKYICKIKLRKGEPGLKKLSNI